MKLIIREYLSMLKESKELDYLIPDLLLSMGLTPFSRPQIGVRQDGVDIAAVGKDKEDGEEKVFLITIKRGDIDRSSWDSGLQAVRPSLNEIIDCYIPNRLPVEYKSYPKKIILCCGGEIKQEVEGNWVGFAKNKRAAKDLSFSFWGADYLSTMIEQNLLNEYLFPEECRKLFRKSLAIIDGTDEGFKYYRNLVIKVLDNAPLETPQKKIKALRTLNLALKVLFYWGQDENNLSVPYLASEYLILRSWDLIKSKNPFRSNSKSNKVTDEFLKILSTFNSITKAYLEKISPHCLVSDGLFLNSINSQEYFLLVFDIMGKLAVIGLSQFFQSLFFNSEILLTNSRYVAFCLAKMIENHSISGSPPYDGHIIDISLAIILLYCTGHGDFASNWVEKIVDKCHFAYKFGKYYPICTDSFEDLIDMSMGNSRSKKELTEISSMFPILAEWIYLLNNENAYLKLSDMLKECLSHTNLQMWFPDKDTENLLFKENASNNSGKTYHSICLPEKMSDLQSEIESVSKVVYSASNISCFKFSMPLLALIASRHFRTPVLPIFWHNIVISKENEQPPE